MKITILHTNDIHGKVDVFPKIATVVDDCLSKGEEVLLLDSGDTLYTSRVPDAKLPKTEAILQLMAKIGYNAWTPGNRDLSPAHSEKVLASLKDASLFPFLAANVQSSRRGAQSKLAAFAKPYHLIELSNMKIGILGLVAGHGNPKKALDRFLPPLREKSDLVIGLLHFGSNPIVNRSLPSEGFDMVLGGHSHEVTHQPRIIDGVPYFQAGMLGKYMVRVDVSIDSKCEVSDSSLIVLEEIEANAPNVQKFVEKNRGKFYEP